MPLTSAAQTTVDAWDEPNFRILRVTLAQRRPPRLRSPGADRETRPQPPQLVASMLDIG